MEYIKIKLICKQRFDFEGKTYFPGEAAYQIERVARRWVSRGLCEYADPNAVTRNGYLKHPKVSIVILIKDALKWTRNCIDSLNRYTNNFELILVDNGSNSKTKEFLRNLDWLDYTLITNKENMGFSYGCNQGIKASKCDYICFLNSDTLLTPNWLGKLMRGFKYEKNIGIVGPSTCHSSTIQSPQVFKDFRNATQEKANQIAEMVREGYSITTVVGFCFVIKKEVFEKIGVFDHRRYGIACHEDIDLVWRAQKAGFKSVWAHGSYVHHFGNQTTKEMGLDPKEIRRKNKPIFEKRIKNGSLDLYVENDAEIKSIKRVKGTIPILMITYNRLSYTKKAVEAILKNTDYPYKLFIFDNGSTDGTTDYLKGLDSKNIEVTFNGKNSGLVPPMNYFFEKFNNYRYTAKVDNDTVMEKGWLSKLKKVLDEYPLFCVEGNHYLMLSYDIEKNDDYYKHLYSFDFEKGRLYLSDIVGGTGTLIRTALVDNIPEAKGTLSGWITYQVEKGMPSAFYSGVWFDRLDQTGTNKYKEKSDYPEYDRQIDKLRPRKKISSKVIREDTFKNVYKRMEEWHASL